MTKLILLGFIFLFASCETLKPSSESSAFNKFLNLPLGKQVDLRKELGEPVTVDSIWLNGRKIERWSYIKSEFLLENYSLKEKRFLPDTGDPESSLDFAISSLAKKVKLERRTVKCRHNNEIAMFNADIGLVILTKEESNPKVALISYSIPELFNFWKNENIKKKCGY